MNSVSYDRDIIARLSGILAPRNLASRSGSLFDTDLCGKSGALTCGPNNDRSRVVVESQWNRLMLSKVNLVPVRLSVENKDMSFPLQPLTLGNISVAAGMESIGGQEAPKISSLILSLSIAALTLSLSFAVVISLIVWVVG